MPLITSSSFDALTTNLISIGAVNSLTGLTTEQLNLHITTSTDRTGVQAISGWVKGINMGGPSTTLNDGGLGSGLFYGVVRNNSEGNPAPPSLEIRNANKWRFKWTVTPGVRSITVRCKQPVNLTPRPSVVIKSDSSLGIPIDLSATAPSGTGWVDIGPISFSPTATGAVWVELTNNVTSGSMSSAFFDHIVVS